MHTVDSNVRETLNICISDVASIIQFMKPIYVLIIGIILKHKYTLGTLVLVLDFFSVHCHIYSGFRVLSAAAFRRTLDHITSHHTFIPVFPYLYNPMSRYSCRSVMLTVIVGMPQLQACRTRCIITRRRITSTRHRSVPRSASSAASAPRSPADNSRNWRRRSPRRTTRTSTRARRSL